MVVEQNQSLWQKTFMDRTLKDARPLGRLELACPVRTAIGVISGKWKPTILRSIFAGRSRYGEIREDAAGIGDQTLTRHLRELSADGVVVRDPSGTSYRLTPQGLRLAHIMEALEGWGQGYLEIRTGHPQ